MEPGKTYLTRTRKRITIIDTPSFDSDFPIVGMDEKRRLHKFTREGFFVGKGFINDMDLVKEVV